MLSDINIVKASDNHRPLVIALLETEKLPVEDLQISLDNFFLAQHNDKIVGAIGLELYASYGLLRSMVVSKEYRNHTIASKLVEHLESYSRSLGIRTVYLLTETAPGYFEKKGYERINREIVPAELKLSSEFSHVCPVTAIVMKKELTSRS